MVPSASALAPPSRHRVVASVFPSASSLAPSNLDPAKNRKATTESTKPSVQNRRPNPFRQRLRYQHRSTYYQICHRFRHRKLMQKPTKIDRFFMVLGGQKPPRSTPGGPGSPGGSQVGPRRVPGEPRGRPKRLPGHPWSAPRSPRGVPRVAQSHPEAPKSTPKRVKWRQKRPQDRF